MRKRRRRREIEKRRMRMKWDKERGYENRMA